MYRVRVGSQNYHPNGFVIVPNVYIHSLGAGGIKVRYISAVKYGKSHSGGVGDRIWPSLLFIIRNRSRYEVKAVLGYIKKTISIEIGTYISRSSVESQRPFKHKSSSQYIQQRTKWFVNL